MYIEIRMQRDKNTTKLCESSFIPKRRCACNNWAIYNNKHNLTTPCKNKQQIFITYLDLGRKNSL